MSNDKKTFYPNTKLKAGHNKRAPNAGPKSVLIDSLVGDFAIPLAQALAAGITGNKEKRKKAVANVKEKAKKIEKDAKTRTKTGKLNKIKSKQASEYTTAKKKGGGKIASKKKQPGHNRLY